MTFRTCAASPRGLCMQRYADGLAVPCHSCIKLVELVFGGVLPFNGWEDVRFSRYGLAVPGMRYEISLEQIRNLWADLQDLSSTRCELNNLRNRLKKLESDSAAPGVNFEVAIRKDGHEVGKMEVKL